MSINFRKLLPESMRTTRWGEFIDVFQLMTSNLKQEKINRILSQFDIDRATYDEKVDMAATFGFRLLTLDGYTSTETYLDKEIRTIVNRIQAKNSKLAYDYLGYIFNLRPQVYQLTAIQGGRLTANKLSTIYDPEKQIVYATTQLDQEGDNILAIQIYDNWWLDEISGDLIFSLDSENENVICDGIRIIYGDPAQTGRSATTLDSDDFVILDPTTGEETGGGSTIITAITRNMNFSYGHKFIENEQEFMSLNTLKVLKNDVDQIHKATEVIYYEPIIEFEVRKDKVPVTKIYKDYTQTLSANQESVLIGEELDNVLFVQFGTGSWNVSNSGLISGVQQFSYQYPEAVSGLVNSGLINNFENAISGVKNFDFVIDEYNRFSEFTEAAVFNTNSGIIAYSKFPKIQWNPEMYNNIQFKITFV